jgi:hypothetical protein
VSISRVPPPASLLFPRKCYKLFEEPLTYLAADKVCRGMGKEFGTLGTSLVQIENYTELETVKGLCRGNRLASVSPSASLISSAAPRWPSSLGAGSVCKMPSGRGTSIGETPPRCSTSPSGIGGEEVTEVIASCWISPEPSSTMETTVSISCHGNTTRCIKRRAL